MAVYISLTAAVVLLGMLVRSREYVPGGAPYGMEPALRENRAKGGVCRRQAFHIGIAAAVFLLLAAVSACRIAVGNDYWVYRFQFNLIMQQRTVSYEAGFNAVVWAVQWLFGYDNYLPVFAVFSLLTCFLFVRAAYDQAQWFGGTVFLLMTGGFYFSSLNSVRYYLVLAAALYGMKYVMQKRYGMFVLWIIAASLFHKSVLLVIPVYLAAWFLSGLRPTRRRCVLFAVLFAVLAAAFIAGEPLWRKLIFFFYPFYQGSAFDVRSLSWANIAKCAGTLLLCAVCRKRLKEDRKERFYFFLNLGGLMLYTCCSFIPEISRVGYYLIASQIFLLPDLLAGMKKGVLRILCISGTAVSFLLYFALFLYQAYDVNVRLLPYRTWIFD